jgi:glycosyltransferase involved in cell wall biosynthesis
MNILGFCEGSRPDTGSIGLFSVPQLHRALAGQGNRVAIAIAGTAMSSAIPMLRLSLDEIFDTAESQVIGAVSYPALGRFCFSRRLYADARRSAERADFITLHSVFSYPVLAGYALARRYDKPYGLWPHGVFAPVQRRVSPGKKWLYSSVVGRRILDAASLLFYSAEGERSEALELALRAPSVVVPHGVDTMRFESLPEPGAFRHKYLRGHLGPLVLFLGRLNIKKGLDLLIKAMARVRRDVADVRLAIVGGGHPQDFTDQVSRWVSEAGISDLTVMTGPLDQHETVTAFTDCDLFVLPSAAENFGHAMFEAMACGRPVICSDSLNYAHEVARWDAGIVVPRIPEAIAAAIVELLVNPNRRITLGVNGRALARRYSWEACGQLIDKAILSVLTRQPLSADLHPA